MTCKTEDRQRREYYWTNFSGSRSRQSFVQAVIRDGHDDDLRVLFDDDGLHGERHLILQNAVRRGRDALVLDWAAAQDAEIRCVLPRPERFNSRAMALKALALFPPLYLETTEATLNDEWDIREGVSVPSTFSWWTIWWAFETQDRPFFLAHRHLARQLDTFKYEAYPSDEFLDFLIETGWVNFDVLHGNSSLPRLQLALRRGLPLAKCRFLWTRESMERDAWLAKEKAIDIQAAWRKAQTLAWTAPARDWIVIMDYHGLPWTTETLRTALSDDDYAAVIWHLKQPARFLDIGHGCHELYAAPCRTIDDLLANGWLSVEPQTSVLAFRPVLPIKITLNSDRRRYF